MNRSSWASTILFRRLRRVLATYDLRSSVLFAQRLTVAPTPQERGIKLIICLEDYWLSVDRYIDWSPTAGAKTDFYSDWTCRQLFKAHLSYFVNRKVRAFPSMCGCVRVGALVCWEHDNSALTRVRVRVCAHRLNSITGVRYREDPTIFAWNLSADSSLVTA